jgi:hypothetical protein
VALSEKFWGAELSVPFSTSLRRYLARRTKTHLLSGFSPEELESHPHPHIHIPLRQRENSYTWLRNAVLGTWPDVSLAVRGALSAAKASAC